MADTIFAMLLFLPHMLSAYYLILNMQRITLSIEWLYPNLLLNNNPILKFPSRMLINALTVLTNVLILFTPFFLLVQG